MRSRDQMFECARGIWQLLRLKEVKEKSRISSFILARNFFFNSGQTLQYNSEASSSHSFSFHLVIFSRVCIPDH